MEGLLHPVGPEEVRTYWIRRGGAMAVLVVLLIGLGFIVSNLGRTDGNATAAETSAVPEPVAASQPATTQEPPPAPAPPGVPDDITNEEAVPIPSSARAAGAVAADATEPADEPAPDGRADPQPEATLEPEPANTFHLTPGAPPPPLG